MDMSPRNLRRAGFAYQGMLGFVAAVLVLAAAAWIYVPRLSHSNDSELPMLHVVSQSDFVHDIVERGAVESASNIEVRCEVQAQNSAGTRILEVVPEGTYVKKGDLICRLDSSALENDQLKQTSVVENAKAAKIQAESDHETAIKTLSEYEEGKYKIDRALILADLAVAEENARRAADTVRYSKELLQKGYITSLQLRADEFAAKKADTDSVLRWMVLVAAATNASAKAATSIGQKQWPAMCRSSDSAAIVAAVTKATSQVGRDNPASATMSVYTARLTTAHEGAKAASTDRALRKMTNANTVSAKGITQPMR